MGLYAIEVGAEARIFDEVVRADPATCGRAASPSDDEGRAFERDEFVRAFRACRR